MRAGCFHGRGERPGQGGGQIGVPWWGRTREGAFNGSKRRTMGRHRCPLLKPLSTAGNRGKRPRAYSKPEPCSSAWTSRPALYFPFKIEVDLQWSLHAVLKNAQAEPLPASYTLANAPILDRGKPLARKGKLPDQLGRTGWPTPTPIRVVQLSIRRAQSSDHCGIGKV